MKNRLKRIILGLLVLFANEGHASDRFNKEGADRNLPLLISLYCSEREFLSSLDITTEGCARKFKKHSGECARLIETIEPPKDPSKERDQVIKEGASLSRLYVMCIKSHVYEEVFDVPNL